MNKKVFKRIKARELDSLLRALGAPRMQIAEALDVGESTFRRWVRNRQIPSEAWDKLNSDEFRENWDKAKTSKILNKFDERHYETSSDVARPLSPGDNSPEKTLGTHTLNELVDEIENRGWKVQISRKTDKE